MSTTFLNASPPTDLVTSEKNGCATISLRHPEKDEAVLAMKGLAIIGVVFFHVLNRRLEPETISLLTLVALSMKWSVLAFLCASGYVHAIADSRHPEQGILPFVLSRVRRLLLPFIAFNVIYITSYHLIQHSGLIAVRPTSPSGYFDKLLTNLWPLRDTFIEHLYFLPLLFLIAVAFRVSLLVRHTMLRALALVTSWIVATVWFPDADYTGFSPGVAVWGLALYGTGYLLSSLRRKAPSLGPLCVVLASLAFACACDQIMRVVPLLLLLAFQLLGTRQIGLLCLLGEASGTIYIYHTPLLLQPLIIVASYVKAVPQQLLLVVLAAVVVLAVCSIWYFRIRQTRLAWTLL